MSAFLVGYDHIDALLTFASDSSRPASYRYPGGERMEITTANATGIGRVLLAENERSLAARYSVEEVAAGDFGPLASGYKFKRWAKPQSPVAILKGCDCFDYQACETDDYEETLACRIIDAIRQRAISRLPGYEDAEGWEFRR